jgi:hypothetical protein
MSEHQPGRYAREQIPFTADMLVVGDDSTLTRGWITAKQPAPAFRTIFRIFEGLSVAHRAEER